MIVLLIGAGCHASGVAASIIHLLLNITCAFLIYVEIHLILYESHVNTLNTFDTCLIYVLYI